MLTVPPTLLVVIGTSAYLMEHSHGKDMAYIKQTAIEVINFVKSRGLEIRFSTEDSFRSDLVDLLSIYSAVDKVGVNRVGIADTVGCASPRQGKIIVVKTLIKEAKYYSLRPCQDFERRGELRHRDTLS